MKKTALTLTAAVLGTLLLAGCTQAAATDAAQAAVAPAPVTAEGAVTETTPAPTAAAPVAAPAGGTTAGIAGSADPASGYITEEAAKAAALAHAGLAETELQSVRAKLDYEDGRAVYDVEFVQRTDSAAAEYDYEIDALSGEVVSYNIDAENYAAATGTAVTAEQAKQIALTHAGVAETDTRSMEMETDRDHGRTVYEFSWKVGRVEYEYDIDADTGAILNWSQEQDD